MIDCDALIVGGGPAGLSAALLLGRSRRSALVCDSGEPRNAASHASHSFLTRDGTPPGELRQIAREQLAPYPSITIEPASVVDISQEGSRFAAVLDDGRQVVARRVVLATGVRDELPEIPGLAALWGTSAFMCPYCDGWEVRDQPLALRANGEMAMHMAPLLRQWSRDLVLLTDGPARLSGAERRQLEALQIPLIETLLARLEGRNGVLSTVVFADGSELARQALFLRPTMRPRSELAARLGCELVEDVPIPGLVRVDATWQTTAPGVYAAGDVASPLHQVFMATASGGTAGAMINHGLVKEETGSPDELPEERHVA